MRQPHAYGESDCDVHSDRNGDPDGDIHAYSNPNCDGIAEANTYAAASAHVAVTALGLVWELRELARTTREFPASNLFQKA
jgi:hypothetical protein